MAQTAESSLSANDLIELPAEERHKAMWDMPLPNLLKVMKDLMHNNQNVRATARLDALTIWAVRTAV